MAQNEQVPIDIFDLAEILKNRWRSIVSITLAFAVVAGAYILTMPKQPENVPRTRLTSYAEIVPPYATDIAGFLQKRAQAIALISPRITREMEVMHAPLEEVFFNYVTREAFSYIQRQNFLSKNLKIYESLVSSQDGTPQSLALLAANSSVFEVTLPAGEKIRATPVVIKYSTIVPGVAQQALARFLDHINLSVNGTINDSMNIAIDAEIAILKSQLTRLTKQNNANTLTGFESPHPPAYSGIQNKIDSLTALRNVTPAGSGFSYRARPANEYSATGIQSTGRSNFSALFSVMLSATIGFMIACIFILAQYAYEERKRGKAQGA